MMFLLSERENNNGFYISFCILDKVFHYLSLMLNDELYRLNKTVPFTVCIGVKFLVQNLTRIGILIVTIIRV